ncbi:MAG: hypothetical protein E7474_11250 [Ruminococcaceae bacterium]|nr:hypothetical protein [Oscillospiraceae bacterium]
MDRRMNGGRLERLRAAAGKYKYALAVVLLGAALMLLPAGSREPPRAADADAADSRTAAQSEMEAALSAFDGVGRLRLLLSVDPATQRCSGALVVCEGAGSAAVRLQLTQAVSALTGLSSDKIAIVKGKP